MSFGPHTELKLVIDGCAVLPDVKFTDVGRDVKKEIEEAERKVAEAEDEKKKALEAVANLGPFPSPLTAAYLAEAEPLLTVYREKGKLSDEAAEALRELKYSIRDKDKVRANAFVTVTLDGDEPGSMPVVFTHTYRDNNRPQWNETFDDIPLGLLAHGKWGRQLLSGTQSVYCPTRLNFWVYHDKGEDEDMEADCWKPDLPKRDLLLGRACLNFGALICNGHKNEHELAVLDKFESPIPGCKLRVQTQMCTSSVDALNMTRSMPYAGGLVCGKPEKAGSSETCRCAGDKHGEEDLRFERPSNKHHHRHPSHKSTKKAKFKCRSHHVHF